METTPRTEEEWGAYVARRDEKALKWSTVVSAASRPIVPAKRKVTMQELDAIIASATTPRGNKAASGLMRGLECTSTVLEFLSAMTSDPVYAVGMFVLVLIEAKGSVFDAVGFAIRAIIQIAEACFRLENSDFEIGARAAMARFFTPMSADKKGDAFACLMYACARHAAHIGVAVGAGYRTEDIALLSSAISGIVRDYTQIDDLALCSPESPERETYSGITKSIEQVVNLERAMRAVPGLVVLLQTAFTGEPNTVYSAQYATYVIHLVDLIKDTFEEVMFRLGLKEILDTVRDYRRTRLFFYLLLSLKYHSDGGATRSFLDVLLMLECPLCARIVLYARSQS
jgi:hypothetical protein